jgi:hypothetical protein
MEIPKVNNSYVLNCIPYWVVWRISCPALPHRGYNYPLSSVSTLWMLSTHQSLSSCVGYQINYCGITVLEFKSSLFSLMVLSGIFSNGTGRYFFTVYYKIVLYYFNHYCEVLSAPNSHIKLHHRYLCIGKHSMHRV